MNLREIIGRVARQTLGDELYADLRRRSLQLRSNRRAFTEIYERNLWGSDETLSGTGSTLDSSASLRGALPRLLADLDAKSILDAGCGDFNWMKAVDLGAVKYIGVDVVEPLVRRSAELYGSESRRFMVADMTRDKLPQVDVVLCRQCLIHLSNRQVLAALGNIERSKARYLLATTFPGVTMNNDIWAGSFRPLNLEASPFNLPKPMLVLHDSQSADDQSAVLALWRLAELGPR